MIVTLVVAELLKVVAGAMNQAQKLNIIINTNHSQAEKTKYNTFPATSSSRVGDSRPCQKKNDSDDFKIFMNSFTDLNIVTMTEWKKKFQFLHRYDHAALSL